MKANLLFFIYLLFMTSLLSCSNEAIPAMDKDTPLPPAVQKIKKILSLHDQERVDNYYWLNEKSNPKVIEYLKKENAYFDAVTQPLNGLKKSLFKELKNRVQKVDEDVPYLYNDYWYYRRFVEKGEYPIYCRKYKSLDAKEEIILDGNKMAKGLSYFSIGDIEVSDNQQLIAYSIDTIGRRNYTVYFKNLSTGKVLDEKIDNTENGNYAWGQDNTHFYYMIRDEQTLLASKVFRHKMGRKKDELIYEEKDNAFYMGLWKSKSGKYIYNISSQNGVSSEYRLLNRSENKGKLKVFYPRKKNVEYFIDDKNDTFYIHTNAQGAENFKLMKVKKGKEKEMKNWKTIIPHQEDVYIQSFEIFNEFLVVVEKKEALKHYKIMHLKDKNASPYYMTFPDDAYATYLEDNYEFDTPWLRFSYSSMTQPWSVYDYNMKTREKVLKKTDEIPSGYDGKQYESKRIWINTSDGKKMPISIVFHKSYQKNGKGKLLLYGYGSYGYAIEPSFSRNRLSLLDRGFAFAIAHIRGGDDLGRKWYFDGKLLNKKNTFNDFIDASKYLIRNGWVDKNQLYALGGSAGGLLMGAIINQSPQLYRGVIAAVPFVDVLTTMSDETIPLTTNEYEEWGNPNIKKYFDYIKSYSPYDNVSRQNYPNLLVLTGLHDSQVQYFEPAKWVAKLREYKTDDNLLLFNTNMEAGHGGSSGRFKYLEKIADQYAFLLSLSNQP